MFAVRDFLSLRTYSDLLRTHELLALHAAAINTRQPMPSLSTKLPEIRAAARSASLELCKELRIPPLNHHHVGPIDLAKDTASSLSPAVPATDPSELKRLPDFKNGIATRVFTPLRARIARLVESQVRHLLARAAWHHIHRYHELVDNINANANNDPEVRKAWYAERCGSPGASSWLDELFFALRLGRHQRQREKAARDYELSLPSNYDDWMPEVRHSKIMGGGRGVFIKGRVLAGTVLCFYPGIVYSIFSAKNLPNAPNVDRDNSYLYARYDGSIIDPIGYRHDSSLPSSYPNDHVDASIARSKHDKHFERIIKNPHMHTNETRNYDLIAPNPFAVGHIINHPNADAAPNVIALPFDFDSSFPSKLRWMIPNRWYSKSRLNVFAKEPCTPSMVLIALRDLHDGEELYFNYRYSLVGNSAPPDWYVDAGQSLKTMQDAKESIGSVFLRL